MGLNGTKLADAANFSLEEESQDPQVGCSYGIGHVRLVSCLLPET